MNKKISFPELVDSIAELTNTSKRISDLFLKELFGIVKEKLQAGESVKIKNFGTFKVTEIASRRSVNVNTGEDMEIPSHRKVSFTPDKSLAEAINIPFEGFETVILKDDLSEEDLKELALIGEEDPIVTESVVESVEPAEVVDDVELPPVFSGNDTDEDTQAEENNSITKTEDNVVSEENIIVTQEDEIKPLNNDSEEVIVKSEYEDSEEQNENSFNSVKIEKRKSFLWGFIGGLFTFILIGSIAIAVCNSCFGYFMKTEEITANDIEQEVIVMDSVQNDIDTVSVTNHDKVKKIFEVKTDTVKPNYYLTKMSRKYYGRYEFWVYIYEENKDKIKNPNKVSPGLVVVIPPAEKYGIDKNDMTSINKAKKFAEKIK